MDDHEFTEWASGCQQGLLRAAWLLTGDAQRAEDLVQEALVKVALRWSRLRDGNPTAYARQVVVRDNISWWRRRRHLDDLSEPAGERAYLELPPAVLPDGRLLPDVQGFSDDRPGGLWVSDGTDWASYSRVDSGAPFDAEPADIMVLDVQVDDDAATIVAAGPEWHDAWVSDDGGLSWTPFGAR